MFGVPAKGHVIDGYRLLRDKFNFSADIILRHHQFQLHAYPKELPSSSHEHSLGLKVLIQEYGRILAIADVYDALHRKDNKFEEGKALTGEEMREKMFELNPDRRALIEELYNVGILERDIISTDIPHPELYNMAWPPNMNSKDPQETARLVALAAALEPLADKAGCTTRFTDISRHLKLEYFITGAINISREFEKLAKATDIFELKLHEPFVGIYQYALSAQEQSIRNRSGGRINQGIIELLVPVVAAQHSKLGLLSTEEVINRSREVLQGTGQEDVEYLIAMKQFAHDLCRYNNRPVPEHPEAKNVFEYYSADLASSTSHTGIAHNNEFINNFPTVRLMHDTIMGSSKRTFVKKVEEAFRHGIKTHDPSVGRGFLADCVAAAIYLCLSQHPKIQLVI